MRLALLAFCALALLQAADVSGKWAGTSEFVNKGGEVRTGAVTMELKQTGESLEGKVGPSPERQQDIRDGKVVGDKVTFKTADAVIELTLETGALVGEAKFHREYGVITMKLKLKRE